MPIEQRPSAPCFEDAILSPLQQKEKERVLQLFDSAFVDEIYTQNPKHLAVIAEVRDLVNAICLEKKTLDDFFAFQKRVEGNTDYDFLGDSHPRLNATGWRIFLARIDPLKYGKDLRLATSRVDIGRIYRG